MLFQNVWINYQFCCVKGNTKNAAKMESRRLVATAAMNSLVAMPSDKIFEVVDGHLKEEGKVRRMYSLHGYLIV